MKKSNPLGKIALLGGAAYLATKVIGKDTETSPAAKSLALNGSTNPDLRAELIALLQSDPAIRAQLKGPAGNDGTPGGPAGAKGADGLNAPNFESSLLVNGAFEDGKKGWNGNFELSSTLFRGMPIAQINVSNIGCGNTKSFYVLKDRLTRIRFWYKSDASNSLVYLNPTNITGNVIVAKTNGSTACFQSSNPIATDLTERIQYVGGIGTLGMNFPDSAVKAILGFASGNSTLFEITNIVVENVPLGSPVPHNLPWLPVGQIVFNATTNQTGRWNGTSFEYFN